MRTSWLLVGLVVIPVAAWSAEKHEERVSLEEVPAAVKATLAKEAAAATLDGVDKEIGHGQTFYQAEFSRNGHASYVQVAQDGTVLKRETAAQERRSEPSSTRTDAARP